MSKERQHIEICEPWHIERRYIYLHSTPEEAWAMYREDIKDDPSNPANRQARQLTLDTHPGPA